MVFRNHNYDLSNAFFLEKVQGHVFHTAIPD